MKISKLAMIACIPALLLTITACSGNNEGNREIIRGNEGTITIIDDGDKKPEAESSITVGDIKEFEKMMIFGWLDEDTVLVSRENNTLPPMNLEELGESYPRSLYQYNIRTKELVPLLEKENVFLSGISLSPDKKHFVYVEYTIGDPSYYVMNLETKKSFSLANDSIGGAMSGGWADDGSIIGASYIGGAYTATVDGKIGPLAELSEGMLFLVVKLGNRIYYNTQADNALKVLDLDTKEIKDMGLSSVSNVIPSPDGKQLLVERYEGSKLVLLLCDLDGGNTVFIAESEVLAGISWSPDQRMIAYTTKDAVSGATVKGLYVHDLLAGEATRIAADVENGSTLWSPSGNQLSYNVWNSSGYSTGVIAINASLQPQP